MFCIASRRRLSHPASRTRKLPGRAIAPWLKRGRKRDDGRHQNPACDEARRLHAASRKHINDTRLLKQQLMEELSVWIAQHHLKQVEAAEILMVSRPRVSDVVNKKTAKFTIDTLVEMLSRVGKPVKLAIS
jgi:predicted XRE-type DNA-binding protein